MIQGTYTKTLPDGKQKRFYKFTPKIRLDAISKLTIVERELAKISGYSQADILIDARNMAQALPEPKDEKEAIDPMLGQGANKALVEGRSLEDQFHQLTSKEMIDIEGEVVGEEEHE